MRRVPLSFFQQDAVAVARLLLGCVLRVGNCYGIIVETEAYKDDSASHAAKRTERSELMYSTFGYVYVYLIYGMYYCLNFTTNGHSQPGAVLIRAVQPVKGISFMQQRRNIENIHSLCSGPGKLCQAFGITSEHNGQKIHDTVQIFFPSATSSFSIVSGPRVGIQKGLEYDWRFYIKDNNFVSK